MASDVSPGTGGGPEFAHDITEVVAVFSDDARLGEPPPQSPTPSAKGWKESLRPTVKWPDMRAN
jgi:hypothetical protein